VYPCVYRVITGRHAARFTKWSSTGRYPELHREREEGIRNSAVHVIAEIGAAQDTRA
jgi:hypothetical protein